MVCCNYIVAIRVIGDYRHHCSLIIYHYIPIWVIASETAIGDIITAIGDIITPISQGVYLIYAPPDLWSNLIGQNVTTMVQIIIIATYHHFQEW